MTYFPYFFMSWHTFEQHYICICVCLLTSWRTFWCYDVLCDIHFYVITYFPYFFMDILMSWRMFWHHIYLPYFLMYWCTFWCYDVLFDIMAYILYQDVISILFYIMTCFPYRFFYFTTFFDVMVYFLTSWHTFHTFGRHDVLSTLFDVMIDILVNSMMYFLMLWHTFWLY